MTISVASLFLRAGDLLQDVTNIRWTEAELLRWLNDGQREIVLHLPEASATNTSVLLVAGTKQTLPTLGLRLLDLPRNMGVGGATPGRAIRLVQREVLDAQIPEWHNSTASVPVKHFMFDERNPRNYYVYPPVPASPPAYAEAIYSTAPTDCTLGGNLNLDDIYGNVILDYILYRAYSKDAEYAANGQRATSYYQVFVSALGGKKSEDMNSSPNKNDLGAQSGNTR
jgi:hypothetical protein